MDDVARLPMADRADLFVAAARQRGLTAEIIEKDFEHLLEVLREIERHVNGG